MDSKGGARAFDVHLNTNAADDYIERMGIGVMMGLGNLRNGTA